ncbi:signal recognition particle, SRP19 subunit [Halteromyces radiatus]|uniref:signal recognition particle, SRP19 subunit n=1 Tax=Halteromyces radiatus TaxID=101107 RepID=UPI00221EC4A4|nr:signal recognition particle, SRP19 subunit [Halteromyces radiatus]KAI8099361.1 signal recognition particle, SRP19 subunit [Halteromyces radiatus]
MSMLNKLKQNANNPVFLDDDDDIDNMDFPLPSSSNNNNAGPSRLPGMPNMDMNELSRMMQQFSGGQGMPGMPGMSAPTPAPSHVAVASGPNGVQRLDPSEYKDWVCVYPCYIDVDKSVNEGRKIVKEKAVKNPHAYHMAVAVQQLGLTVVYEGKCHPRDWANPGRVRVQLKNKNNFFINNDIITRKQLFYAIAARLPEAQKNNEIPKHVISPMTSLAQVEALADEQRKAQGLPTLAEMNAQAAAQQQPVKPTMPKKQKIKYVRG